MNRAILMGRVKDDPVMALTPSRAQVVNLVLITDDEWHDARGAVRTSRERHRLVCWGSLAEKAVGALKAGQQVLVEGRLQTREWDSRQNGDHRVVTEVVVTHLHLLDPTGSVVATTLAQEAER